MLSRDSKDEFDQICVWTCDITSRSYFDKMNSTLGSVVPLAMFWAMPKTTMIHFLEDVPINPILILVLGPLRNGRHESYFPHWFLTSYYKKIFDIPCNYLSAIYTNQESQMLHTRQKRIKLQKYCNFCKFLFYQESSFWLGRCCNAWVAPAMTETASMVAMFAPSLVHRGALLPSWRRGWLLRW